MPTYTANLESDVGKIRILVHDRVVENGAHFSDEELAAYLDIEGGDIRLAAATALDAWASDFAVSGQYAVRIGDYSRTPVGAAAMGARAKVLRDLARTTPAFAIADMGRWDSFLRYVDEEVLRV